MEFSGFAAAARTIFASNFLWAADESGVLPSTSRTFLSADLIDLRRRESFPSAISGGICGQSLVTTVPNFLLQCFASFADMRLMDTIETLLDQIEVLPASPSLLPKLLPKPIVTVQDAVARVGYQSVYLLVAMINGANSFPTPSPKGIDVSRLWAHSVTTAFSSKYIAESTQQDASLLFTAGLLHDVGKIVIAQAQPGALNGELYGPSETAGLLHEKELFGFTHADVGTALLRRWGLPEKLVTAVSHHHAPHGANGLDPLAACVELGDLFSHGQTDRRVLATPQFMTRLTALDLGPTAMQGWFKKLQGNQPLIDGMSQLHTISKSAKK
jgi:putative nucleotidyltransferase with HDIG domain